MIAWASYPYQGRTVLVTGAGTGTRRATACAFLERGAYVAVLGRRPEPLREAVAEFDADRVQVLAADVMDADALRHAVSAIVERFGGPDAECTTGAVMPVDGGTSASSGTPRPVGVLSEQHRRLHREADQGAHP